MMRRLGPISPSLVVALAVLAACAHALWALTATVEKSMTADEIAHLTAGRVYNDLGDFRFQPENGNLAQRWAALPLSMVDAPLPPTTLSSWQGADVWKYGHAFFYEQTVPARRWLFLGRAMISIFSAATGLLVFFWARAIFGTRGGLVSLVLFVFCPTFLAHGALATSDVIMAFFFLAGVGAWWRHLEHPGAGGAAVSAVVFGLAWVAKFSAILLLPMFALCAAAWIAGRVPTAGWRAPLWRLGRTTLVHAVVAWGAIWVFYGLRFNPFLAGVDEGARYYHGWDFLLADLGWPRPALVAVRNWHLLPDAFLYGFTFVYQFAKQRAAFFNGEHGILGWPAFFPYAFLVKSTPALLVVVLTGVLVAGRRLVQAERRQTWTRWRPLVPLAALFVVYWVSSVTSHLNIGHRHILPTYPVLFIAAGAFGTWLDRRRPLALGFVVLLLAWHASDSWRIRPHYLAYFNAFAGGPGNGWRHLVDSSLDWGQDLPGLRRWLDEHGRREKVFLSYFGTGDARYEGIQATLLPTLPEVGPPRPWHALAPGIYAVSATMLQQVYLVPGGWTLDQEKEYQQLRALEPLLLDYESSATRRSELLREAPAANWTTAWKRYELLRFARLCHYLRVRPPEANIGYSILVYRLREAELQAATGGSFREWAALIEQTVAKP